MWVKAVLCLVFVIFVVYINVYYRNMFMYYMSSYVYRFYCNIILKLKNNNNNNNRPYNSELIISILVKLATYLEWIILTTVRLVCT